MPNTTFSHKVTECFISQAARRLRFSADHTNSTLSKGEALEIKAAAEERYYSHDFEKSLALAELAILVGDGMLPTDRKDLLLLQERCKTHLKN